jgi:hypothetical protein
LPEVLRSVDQADAVIEVPALPPVTLEQDQELL